MKAPWMIGLVLLLSSAATGRVEALDDESHAVTYTRAQDWLWLAAGAAAGLVLHESGHVAYDLLVHNRPHLIPVRLGPLPFFAIAPQEVRSARLLYGASMMGFFVEAVYTEVIFANYPDLAHRHRPFAEGLLAFHVALDLGYALTGIAHVGPAESDVNSMARAADVSPRAIGFMLVVPLLFDVLRYLNPELLRGSLWLGGASRVLMFRGALTL